MGRADKTRAALQDAALALFTEHGYDATTTAQIARRAGVSEMTLFRHFPTKGAFVVDDPYDPLIASAISGRPADESALRATVRGIEVAWESIATAELATIRARLRIVAQTPSLRGALAAGSAATEQAIAASLIAREVTAAEADIVAAAVLAGLSTALLEWSLGDDPDVQTALSAAFRALDPP